MEPRAQEGDNPCGVGVAQAAMETQCTAVLVGAQVMGDHGGAIRHDKGFIKVQHNLQQDTPSVSTWWPDDTLPTEPDRHVQGSRCREAEQLCEFKGIKGRAAQQHIQFASPPFGETHSYPPSIAQAEEPRVAGERACVAGPWQHGAGVCLPLHCAPYCSSTRLSVTHTQA